MNIMLINHYAGSDEYGMEFRPYYLAKNWVEMGHSVTIIGANFSHLRKKNPIISKDFEQEIIDGIRYVWVKTNKYKGNNIGRVINVLTMVNKLKSKAKYLAEKYDPDVVIASSTYPYDIYPAKKIADLSGAKLIFEIHDLWPLTQIEINGLSPKNPLVKSIQKAEDFCYKNASVVSILKYANLHIIERGFEKTPYVHIPNGIELKQDNTTPPNEILELTQKLKSNNKFITMYLGGLQPANALEKFIESSKYLDQNKAIIIVGNGIKKQEYISLVPENAKDKVFFVDAVKKSQVFETLKLADCLYIGAKKCPLYSYGIGMNKIFDYMYSSKPIIFGIETTTNYIADSECGLTVDPDNPKNIAEAINELSKLEKQQLEEMGQKGKNFVIKNHDYKKLAEDFIKAINS